MQATDSIDPLSTHPAARFRADLGSVIEAHGVRHRAPAEIWQDGLYLGNGDIAATVYGEPWHTRVLLNKGDIWDERSEWLDEQYDPADFDWNRTKDVFARAVQSGDWSEYQELPRPEVRKREGDQGNYSAFQPAGYLGIRGDLPEGYNDYGQTLSFHRAKVECSFTSGDKKFAYSAYTHADHNILAIDITTEDPESWPQSFELHRDLIPFRKGYTPDPHQLPPEFGHDDDTMWMTMTFVDGFAFAVVAQTPGIALEFEQDEHRVTAHIAGSTVSHIPIRLTIVTGQDASPEELVAMGKRNLVDLLDEKELRKSHERWWADFWRAGWISLPEKLVENLWYAEIYKIASCSRKGGQAPGQLAHWSGFPDPPWRGDYHTNINIQENYWPIYTANHPELGWPFYDLYLGILDYIIEDTRQYTGQPGARFVRGHGRSGRPHGRGPDWEMWPGAGAWLSSHFWWHYQFTQDVDFLRDCYRMFRACLDYFLAFLGEPDEDGQYNIIPSLAHEQSVRVPVPGVGSDWGRNSPYDLGLLREHLMQTIRASEILGVDADQRDIWKNILANLAPYPIADEGWLEDWEGVSIWESHRHLSPLYPIYPGEEIHEDADAESVRIGRQSVLRFMARGSDRYTGFSFGWMAACAARMGMADEALSALHNHIRAFVNVNGYSLFGPSRFPGLAPYPAERRGPEWSTKLPNCESGGNFCAGINELLLRSPSGNIEGRPLIRVFPAIVDGWKDVRISRLRAQGAFLVTAERRAGETAYVIIESEAGTECRLVHPWPGRAAEVRQDGILVSRGRIENVISFETQAGSSYLLSPEGSAPGHLDVVNISGEADGYRLGIGGPFEKMSFREFNPDW